MLMAENSVKGSLYKARLAMYNVQEANLVIKCKKNKWILIKNRDQFLKHTGEHSFNFILKVMFGFF